MRRRCLNKLYLPRDAGEFSFAGTLLLELGFVVDAEKMSIAGSITVKVVKAHKVSGQIYLHIKLKCNIYLLLLSELRV